MPTNSITLGEIAFIVITLVSRCFIIAVRYGFMSDTRFKLLKSKAKIGWLRKDFLLLSWMYLTPKSIKDESNATMYRLKIYPKEWTLKFVEKLPQDLHKRLAKDDYYEKKQFKESDIKVKIKAQKKMFLKRRQESSFVEEELKYVHKNIRGSLSIDATKTAPKKSLTPPDSNFSAHSNLVQDGEQQETKIYYSGASVLREMCLLETTYSGSLKEIFLIVIVRCILQLVCQFYQNNYSFIFPWYEYILT
jgi:hypothetical protein